MKKLHNKVAVITGGNSGIGLAAAILFARHGAKVSITGRNKETLQTSVAQIGEQARGIIADVSKLDDIKAAYEEVHHTSGNIDVLVVNAGIAVSSALADITEEQFNQTSDINFKGAFFTVQRALPYLNDGASIVLVSSATNEKGFAGYAAYAATKAAVRSLARSFSTELMGRGIRVNTLSPGAVDTPIYARNGGSEAEAAGLKDYMASNMIPAKRLGNVEEIAEALLFLASDDSRYMVGAELVIDGGVKTL